MSAASSWSDSGVSRSSHSSAPRSARLPARSVQPGHLLEDGGGGAGVTGRDLIALGSAHGVLEQEREPSRLGLDLAEVGHRHPGGHAAATSR